MKKNYYFKLAALFLLMISAFVSCQKERDDYYEQPSWLKGNVWELLEKDGNYTIFLAGIEKSGFAEMVKGKGINTVMAPNDEAFKKYLATKGFSTIDQMNAVELKELITYHLLYYSFNKQMLSNYNPYGTAIENDPIQGLYYKFRTRSALPMEQSIPELGRPGKLIHKESFLPIFSNNLFRAKGIDAKTNYEFFYPGSTWNGSSDGFNVSNAQVTEYAIATDNGYVYKIDRVLEPLNTLSDVMDGEPSLSIFKRAYDRFKYLTFDAEATQDYAQNGDSLWVFKHDLFPDIAYEWTTYGGSGMKEYMYLEFLASGSANIFAPTNSALQQLLSTFWANYKPSGTTTFDDLNIRVVRHFIENATTGKQNYILFPEEITKGTTITMAKDTKVNFNMSDVSVKQVCSNGMLYGINNAILPKAFTSIAAPLFQYKKFTMALYIASNGNALTALGNPELGTNLKFFIPTDYILSTNTNIAGNALKLQYRDSWMYAGGLEQLLIESSSESGWSVISPSVAAKFIRNHVAVKNLTPANTAENQPKVWKTLNDFSYLIFRGADSVFTPAMYYMADHRNVPTYSEFSSPATNGKTYELGGSVDASALSYESNSLASMLLNNCPPEYQMFRTLLVESGILTTLPALEFTYGDPLVMFIPRNDLITAGINANIIPKLPTDRDASDVRLAKQKALEEYVKRYIFSRSASFPLDYVFAGSGSAYVSNIRSFHTTNGPLVPGRPAVYKSFKMTDTGASISITDGAGNNINVLSGIPRIYSDGAAYLIDRLIEVE